MNGPRFSTGLGSDCYGGATPSRLGQSGGWIPYVKRIGERLGLTTDFEDFSASNAKISPMLLIVFIENAFKHSKNSTNDRIFVHISLKTWGNRLLFTCVNSYSSGQDKPMDEHSGLGLDNAKKRMELLYQRDYHLVIEESNDTYKVMLQLKMK